MASNFVDTPNVVTTIPNRLANGWQFY